jgi:hypothetical protein
MRRCTRLFRPVFYYLAFWAVALALLQRLLPVHVYEPIAGISIQLLWFLGAYVLVLATIPLLSRITSTGHLVTAVAAVYVLVMVVDTLRLRVADLTLLGYVNMTAWLIPAMFGIAYRRGLLDTRAAYPLGIVMLGVNLALVSLGPYELSLVGFEGQRLTNMAPPSLLLAGHTVMVCAFAIAAAPTLNRWAQRPRVWWLTAIGNSGAMTLYLWHMPALLLMHLGFDQLGLYRYPGQPNLVLLSVIQLLIMAGLVAAAFVFLRRLESTPLPGWDGPVSDRHSVVTGALLCLAGAALLASVKWGLEGHGIVCVTIVVTALMAARWVSRQPNRIPV